MNERIGVIGLGKMGLPMARRLRAREHEVYVFDLQAEPMARAAAFGAVPCADPYEVAARAELSLVAVGFDSEVIAAATGPRGLFAGARTGAAIAVASTVAPGTMQALAAADTVQRKRLGLLDIPLCRGERAVAAGELLLLAGGDPELFARWRPVFACFASDQHHLGPLGAGQVGKMVNNLLLWACTAANYEGLRLAESLGVDPRKLREALLKSSANNYALETWFEPRPMPWAEKDLALVLQTAGELGLPLKLGGVVLEVVQVLKRERGLATPVARA